LQARGSSGVFLLNAIDVGAHYDAAMIDSPPSRISGYGCPRRFDPVENVPQDSSRLGSKSFGVPGAPGNRRW
jgi:hypothetical protein